MARTAVGLEITEEGVRAAEVVVGRTPTVIAKGSVPLPPGAAKDSEIFDLEAVALALRQLWSRAGIRSRRVVLGISSRRVLVREYTTQAMKPELMRQALPFQVQDLLPVPVDQAVLDFYPTTQDGDQVTGLLVAAVAEHVELLITACVKAKLSVDAVDLAPFGLARSVARAVPAGETVAAIHLGDHTTHVVVVNDGVPRFVRIIPVDIATEAVRARQASELALEDYEGRVVPERELLVDDGVLIGVGAEPEGASVRSRRSGHRSAPRSAVAMGDAARADLVARVRNTLSFYSDRAGDAPIKRVLVTGAGASTPGVFDSIAANLPLPVEYLGLGRVATVRGTAPSAEDDLNLLTTVGLALGGTR